MAAGLKQRLEARIKVVDTDEVVKNALINS
jgi:hypothetical protein